MTAEPTIALIGAGYVGTALARELIARGRNCRAAVASKRSAERLASAGLAHQRVDLDTPDSLMDLPEKCSIVYLVPPRRNVDTDERLRQFLQRLPKTITAFVYVSTSGVYGDQNGQLVDESTPPTPPVPK